MRLRSRIAMLNHVRRYFFTGVAILKYLHRVGSASPRDIQRALDLPKTSAFRHLDRLIKDGAVIRTGKTAAIRYKTVTKLDGVKP